MDEKEAVTRALDALLAEPAVAEFHDALAAARAELDRHAAPDDVPALQSGVLWRLVCLQGAGYLDRTPRDDESGASLPSVAELVELARREPPRPAPAGGDALPVPTVAMATSTKSAATFIFLADPQPSRTEDPKERPDRLSRLNEALNALNTLNWPAGMQLTCEGQVITAVDGIFFGGDLCQDGGDYSFADQFAGSPTSFKGGWELQDLRKLYQPPFDGPLADPLTPTNKQPSYFGLGNHDIQGNYNPDNPGTSQDLPNKGTAIWNWWRFWQGNPKDFWRDQMWNFICQMHSGVRSGGDYAAAAFPVTDIDADGDGGFKWREHSFNYRVDLGPVDVYQMHRYGGDSEWGRPDGLEWLRTQLERGGPHRPVIIVQHYPFLWTGDRSPIWTTAQRDDFLRMLAPYNVIALLVGHIHDGYSFAQPVTIPGTGKVLREFRPGAAGDYGAFALLRVTPSTLDVVFGNGDTGSVVWQPKNGQGFALNPFIGWEPVGDNILFAGPPAGHALADDSIRFVYAVGQDRQLYYNVWHATSRSWQRQWLPLPLPPGKTVAGRPTVVSASANTHDLFVVGTDGELWHVSWNSGSFWSQPATLGGALQPDVSVVVTGPDQIDILGRGLDGRLWHLSGNAAGFGSWQQREGELLSSPSAVAWSDTELQMVALGPGSDLLHQWYDRGKDVWSGWESLGGRLSSAPVIVAPDARRLEIFARGADMSLQRRFWDGRGWGSQFGSLGGSLAAGPVAAVHGTRIEVLAPQLDHTVGRLYWDGGWGSFTAQSGQCDTAPDITIRTGAVAADLFALGLDGAIYHKQLT
ncbi:metallophosphoesterase [Dactylosporangium sp. CA-233914]|uniref:metallophosphoesterase n=1 Tax=Dactylosporangium sp. CA-233914 TaxID=3239934 RepID=UPI003D8F40DE